MGISCFRMEGFVFFSELRAIISGVPWICHRLLGEEIYESKRDKKKADDNKRGRISTIRTWVYAISDLPVYHHRSV